ncbi:MULTISPECIES: O-methyltransferase [unclassified Sphingobium]|uniref:O-methyltransferase n=1 Tax=unclassified Sphingobium TaxID=2611147 RepID=UPI0022257DF4|nr:MULTISPECIES: class I SAM-dependent methyltransferase [unclassified Sphingobium]MCW2410387.1 putative O-methyltransferase YrrM [Sphingobium sp. B8D3D]MCW2413920.1 putative O-methyltransferase YrrM [Sphingobium sp. B8D3A]
MTTLVSAPVAPLLDRLFAEADAHSPLAHPAFAAMSKDEQQRLMRSKTDYRSFYAELKDYALPVSRDAGRLLYMLARAMRAETIVEFGTSFGLSTLHLAAALRDNGRGRLITSEFEPSKVAAAKANIAAGGLSDLVEVREGDALETLASDLPETIDLLLLDGAKALYGDILMLVEGRLRPGAVILADNADYCPDYLAHVSATENGYITLPFTDDVELSIRL